ncbi:hypothetical protein LWI29_018033 [Acer saccharum]|uniref:Retrotransposon Copia-like N-terminal domain-containing protein n=1 Tax=Acer saccharum TaxID=4024 RepID=A0AA39V9G9_ACESA|nr:hypothetical protein LWI29_018033 [Acer saccharum]
MASNSGSITLDPFLIHHSNNPTAVLVSLVLSGDNYGTWSCAITMALRAKNKLGFVDGTHIEPSIEKDVPNWARCYDLISSWILNSVSLDICISILYVETAHEIWNDLKERFSQSNAPKIYQLKQSISALKQDNSTLSDYDLTTNLKDSTANFLITSSVPKVLCANTDLKPENIHLDSSEYVKVPNYKSSSHSPKDSSYFKRVPKSSAIKKELFDCHVILVAKESHSEAFLKLKGRAPLRRVGDENA